MWDFNITDLKKPRYISIVEALERDIRQGELKPGDLLLPHRTLAKRVGVTVTTATRAYAEAERRGLISARVGKGTFVTLDAHIRAGEREAEQRLRLIDMGASQGMYGEEPPVAEVMERVLGKHTFTTSMCCLNPAGYREFREVGSRWMRKAGVNVPADKVLVTAGPQHSVSSIVYAMFEAGDCMAVDQLTNPVFKALARRAGVRLEGVPRDAEGMLPEALEALCRTTRVRGLYLTGDEAVPGCVSMSASRREALARIVRAYDIVLVEDDSFNSFDTRRKRCLSALAPAQAIYISCFCGFYAGMRISFVATSPKYYSRVVQGVCDTMGIVSPLCVALACECITSGRADAILRRKRKQHHQRLSHLRTTLNEYTLGWLEYSLFSWLELPEYWSAGEFVRAAEKGGVRLLPSENFYVDSQVPPRLVRISLVGAENMASFKEGVAVLRSVLRRESGYVSVCW